MVMITISEWCLGERLSSIMVIIECHYVLIHFFLMSFWCKNKKPQTVFQDPRIKVFQWFQMLRVFDKYERHLKKKKSWNMIIFLFYRNNFPAQQQFFCKSRSFELLPFRRPNPGAGSESQAVGEHLLHEVILQTYSWYGFIEILFISHNSCRSSKSFSLLLLCVYMLKVKKSWKLMAC